MWRGRHVNLPDAVASCLEQAFGTSVEHVEVIEHSLFARLHVRAVATTRRRRIYLRGSGAEFFQNPWLMLHEYCHVLKQWESRELTTPRYLLECARRGYWNNRFEVEARAFADAHLFLVQTTLKRSGDGSSAQQGFAVVEPAGDEHEQRAER